MTFSPAPHLPTYVLTPRSRPRSPFATSRSYTFFPLLPRQARDLAPCLSHLAVLAVRLLIGHALSTSSEAPSDHLFAGPASETASIRPGLLRFLQTHGTNPLVFNRTSSTRAAELVRFKVLASFFGSLPKEQSVRLELDGLILEYRRNHPWNSCAYTRGSPVGCLINSGTMMCSRVSPNGRTFVASFSLSADTHPFFVDLPISVRSRPVLLQGYVTRLVLPTHA